LHSKRSGLFEYKVFWCLQSARDDQGRKISKTQLFRNLFLS
jgi:hypothetical protein